MMNHRMVKIVAFAIIIAMVVTTVTMAIAYL